MPGVFQTGLEALVEKVAGNRQMRAAMPRAPIAGGVAAQSRRAAQQAAPGTQLPLPGLGQQAAQHAAQPTAQPGYVLSPQEHAQAEQLKTMGPDQRRQALGLPADGGLAREMARANHHIASIPTPPQRPGLMRRMAVPLALGGLAAGYGAMRQLDNDTKRDSLVYAPMTGM